jgi:hypothetical protein
MKESAFRYWLTTGQKQSVSAELMAVSFAFRQPC